MLVRDLLKANPKELICVRENTEILEAMKLLLKNRISCLLVTDGEGHMTGIVSDKDIFKLCYEKQCDFTETRVADIMTTNVIVGVETDELGYIAGLMTNNRIRHVPIVEGEKLIGLVSIGDAVKAQMADVQAHNRYLWQFIDGTYPA